jgi:hypothetical protein
MMYMRSVLTAIFCFNGVLLAQSGGLAPEWEVKKSMDEYASQLKRLAPVLAQVKPQDWLNKGAPEAYVRQLKSCQDELGYLIGSTEKLGRQPDKLTIGLEAYFRADSLQTIVGSLANGTRKYQNPALADLLMAEMNASSPGREKLRQYLTDLATSKEKEFQIMDSEAQRCRSTVTRQPAAPAQKQ